MKWDPRLARRASRSFFVSWKRRVKGGMVVNTIANYKIGRRAGNYFGSAKTERQRLTRSGMEEVSRMNSWQEGEEEEAGHPRDSSTSKKNRPTWLRSIFLPRVAGRKSRGRWRSIQKKRNATPSGNCTGRSTRVSRDRRGEGVSEFTRARRWEERRRRKENRVTWKEREEDELEGRRKRKEYGQIWSVRRLCARSERNEEVRGRKIGREIKCRKEGTLSRFGGKKTNEGERRGEEGDEEDCGGKFGRRKKQKRVQAWERHGESQRWAREGEREWRLVGVSPCRSITPLLLLRHQLSLSFSLFLSFPCSFRFSTFTIYISDI